MSSNLSQEQQAAFEAVNQKYGLKATDFHGTTEDKPTVLSSDPTESHVPPKMISVGSIAALKKMIGRPDSDDDSHITYPEPLSESQKDLVNTANARGELLSGLGAEGVRSVKRAAKAHVMGNSSKVSGYEKLINAVHFPGQLAAFTASTITITAANPLIIKGSSPVVLNYAIMTFQSGGYVQIETDASITVHTIIGDSDFRAVIPPFSGPASDGAIGPTGAQGGPGTNGQSYYNPNVCKHFCTHPPTNGAAGGTGGMGGLGAPGIHGQDGPQVSITVQDTTSDMNVTAGGQDGQAGGKGGPGGAGGAGGQPGQQAPGGGCPTAHSGPQGHGGEGAKGGDGGDGGNGAVVNISYNNITGKINPTITTPQGGNGGSGGPGGAGNPPGPNGPVGRPGTPGKPGVINSSPIVT